MYGPIFSHQTVVKAKLLKGYQAKLLKATVVILDVIPCLASIVR